MWLLHLLEITMIGINFRGQLGNQLFQYAAARIQAERLGCGLVVDTPNWGGRRSVRNALRKRLPFEVFGLFDSLSVHPLTHVLSISQSVLCRPAFAGAPIYGRLKSGLFPRSLIEIGSREFGL